MSSPRNEPNALIHETSPYLLQHARNPVDWKPWNAETLALAKKLQKPILVSIGYSACHWCHVMEHESFEDADVAKQMNDNFVCIKVDREERPDVDQLYMNAAQLITGGGGWPLNCFAFPDGKPFYAGTYFPKEKWLQLLETIKREWNENQDKLTDYANKLLRGIRSTSTITAVEGFVGTKEKVMQLVDEAVLKWSESFDHDEGGTNRAPKFPLPNNYLFLSRYAQLTQNEPILKYVDLTLRKMARGGIYDQIGGGFARYSVDNKWKVPHFEKMLYDNAQLLKLYAEVYGQSKDDEYAALITQTVDFLHREMLGEDDLFYSALDADSEGVEGKYYVWTVDEVQALFPDDAELIQDYFGINERGYWEHDIFIACRTSDEEISTQYNLTQGQLKTKVNAAIAVMLKARQSRIRPGLDDKCLTNWNALMVSGLCAVYKTNGEQSIKQQAIKTMHALLQHQVKPDGSLYHSYKDGRATIDGFLEDYASMITALLDLNGITYNADYAIKAKSFADYTLANFYNESTKMFQFTPHYATDLVAKQTDYFDNVIPSSNSMMCRNLFALSHFFLDPKYRSIALEMIDLIAPRMAQYGSGFSNWMLAILDAYGSAKEIVIVGDDATEYANKLADKCPTDTMIVASKKGEELPVTEGRYQNGKTLIYVCEGNTCHEPVERIDEALKQLA